MACNLCVADLGILKNDFLFTVICCPHLIMPRYRSARIASQLGWRVHGDHPDPEDVTCASRLADVLTISRAELSDPSGTNDATTKRMLLMLKPRLWWLHGFGTETTLRTVYKKRGHICSLASGISTIRPWPCCHEILRFPFCEELYIQRCGLIVAIARCSIRTCTFLSLGVRVNLFA